MTVDPVPPAAATVTGILLKSVQVEPMQRQTSKPVSSAVMSCQVTRIWFSDTLAATTFSGTGGSSVLTESPVR